MSRWCPCSSGDAFDTCCEPYLRGDASAPTAEKLMRSRFTAFAVGDADYLRASWHPATVPHELDLDSDQRWYRLDIVGVDAGGLFDDEGTVEFRAHYKHPEGAGTMSEVSRFVRVGGRWLYLDGVVSR
ncbi:YchJ family protein [Rhodococcus sp. IEGM1428]|uniref:YchJ family protein n=1 Tax=Rhodococcus sp. IEGM1428 TaxID=3392191 RepID=UPI003D10D4DB